MCALETILLNEIEVSEMQNTIWNKPHKEKKYVIL